MRAIIWFTLLFVVAVVAATTLGSNDGLVSFYWSGWRTDVSLNLFLLALALTCFALVTMARAAHTLAGLPRRSREWRAARRGQVAQAALREALAQYFGGRYGRARRAAQQALATQAEASGLAHDTGFTALGHLLAAACAHRLQDRGERDEQLRRVLDLADGDGDGDGDGTARAAGEGARMLAAEWALDDRDATQALELIGALPAGVARRTHVLRLKLQAARLACRPEEALGTARLLVHHQAFTAEAARGLVGSLAAEAFDATRDAAQACQLWERLEESERDDPRIAARAARAAARHGATAQARRWLAPSWERLAQLAADERRMIAEAFVAGLEGIGDDWLPRLEAAQQALASDGTVACAVGCALAELALWERALPLLRQAAEEATLPAPLRAHAWHALARHAEGQSDTSQAMHCYRRIAGLCWEDAERVLD